MKVEVAGNRRTGLLLGVSLGALVVASPALALGTAQQVPPQPSAESPETDPDVTTVDQTAVEPASNPASAQPAPKDQEIVVTGSRIRRNEATSASPLQIIDPTIGQRQGQMNTAELIQSSPIASGSTQNTAAISTNFVTNGGPGSQTISLRGLGAERTLVLLNSRRAGPAGTRGAVTAFDLNVLPQSIIKSVEILKDGASSIYGSDAIAGVVNILTKTDTDGVELLGYASAPLQSGGEQYQASATWGKDLGRGHVLLSADYYQQQELQRSDRKYLDCPESYLFRSDGKTRADLIDPRTNRPSCRGVVWGHVWTYYAYNLPDFPSVILLQPDYGQNLGQWIPGVPPATGYGDLSAPPGYFPVGYLGSPMANALTNLYHPFEEKSSVIPGTKRYTLYADGAFDVTDNVQVYTELLYNKRKTFNDTFTQIYNFGYAAVEPFVGDAFPGFTQPEGGYVILSPTPVVDEVDNKIEVDYYRAVAGVRGDIAGNWRWDAYGQFSRSRGKYTYTQVLKDAINTQNFKTESCVGTLTPISQRPCIDINWVDPDFLRGALTQEQRDFLFDTETGRTKYDQNYLEASATGNLLHLPAGPVGLAVGAAYRRDKINDLPGHITRALKPGGDPNNEDDYVDNAFANPISSGHTFGHADTKEAFGEINIPILQNFAFAKKLEFAGAARVTNVKAVRGSDGFTDKSNNNWTYKILGNWQVNDWLRLRSTYGTSYRAPALFEQFLAGQVSGARQSNIDPCVNWGNRLAQGTITQRQADNCAAEGIPPTHSGAGIQATVFTSGGIGVLDPETSKSLTASLILTPRFKAFPNTDIALTLDYFDIKVEGEIARLGAAAIVYGCYNSEDFPNDPLCDLFERGQDGNPDNIRNVYVKFININRQRNRGLDFTLRARQGLGAMGRLSFLGNATYQLEDEITLSGNEVDDRNGEIGDPKLTADVNAVWDYKNTSVFWGVDFVGKASNKRRFIEENGSLCNLTPQAQAIYGDYCFKVNVPSRFYHSASITQKIADGRFEVTAGVANLLNTKPPRVSTGGVTSIGQVPAVSQYDWLGRRLFVTAKARFR